MFTTDINPQRKVLIRENLIWHNNVTAAALLEEKA